MASLSTDTNGNRRVLFTHPDGRRKTLYLGSVTKKQGEAVKLRVEALVACLTAKLAIDADTAAWVAGVGDDLAAKLHAVGLVPERRSEALGAFLDKYLDRRRADSKGGTVTNLVTVAGDVRRFFGEACPLREVTEARADDFRTHYLTREPKLAPATVSRRLKTVSQFFDHARRLKLIPANPFADVTAPGSTGEANKHYVPDADARRLLEVCNPAWRVMVALSRFGGLRCPSEVLLLRWENVDMATGRMTVDSPKTAHLPGKAYRVVPIFPALRPFIEDAYELSAAGAEFVAAGELADRSREKAKGKQGWTGVSLATRLSKLIRRAGLHDWPRPFHNLRASCETDLMQTHPIHVVCAWLGNTPTVALRHYLTVREADFDKALTVPGNVNDDAPPTQNPTRTGADSNGPGQTKNPEVLAGVRVSPVQSEIVQSSPVILVGDTGFEAVHHLRG